MNRAAIKKFAVDCRKKLIEQTKDRIKEKGHVETIEEVAYSVFRKFIFRKYATSNGCPLSDIDKLFPIDEDEDLLLLNDLIHHNECLGKCDWEEVEIIGWLYQYYFSERHDQVNGMNYSSIRKEDIPAATQLFTPKWIVKYMVDNTLGKFWIDSTGDKGLKEKLPFYLGYENQGIEEEINIQKMDPKSIRILDPACGTGHILVYAFDVLYEIYLQGGYPKRDIPKNILQYNLYGLDIDDKAVELARFVLLMKAWKKDRDIFNKIEKEKMLLNIFSIQESNRLIEEKERILEGLEQRDRCYGEKQVDGLLKTFYDGKEYGSLIYIEDIDEEFWNKRIQYLENIHINNGYGRQNGEWLRILKSLVNQAKIMNQKYDVVLANPPYMGNRKMGQKLKKFVKDHFKDYNGDLFSVFIKRNLDYAKENGWAAFMAPFVWMFIKTYENLRKYIIDNKSIASLIQLEYSGYEEATVPICTFVLRNYATGDLGVFMDLSNFKGGKNQPIKVLEAIKNNGVSYRYIRETKEFKKIPGMPIAYWASNQVSEGFKKGAPLKDIAHACVGLQTSDNKRFVRLWHEVSVDHIGFGFTDCKQAKTSGYKWFPYNKGGEFRKWYGNHHHVVNWKDDGREIRQYNAYLNDIRSSNIGIANTSYYFKRGITWSFVSSSHFGVRFTEAGFIFDTAGSSTFPNEEDLYFLIGLLCSKVAWTYIKMINPTLNFQTGNISMIPVVFPKDIETKEKINILSKECIRISKENWDTYETSWNFHKHPLLLNKKESGTIEESFNHWECFSNKQFERLKGNEENLNNLWIDIYGLGDHITAEVKDEDITIKRANRALDIKSFISYAVGCMFGRYSLDEEGIAFDGGEFDASKYSSFKGKEDGILAMHEEPHSKEDILSKFMEFVKVVFGDKTLKENLRYIANELRKRKGEEDLSCIKRYFLNEFYKDHCKTYQRRPIYWLFTSGRYGAFQGLVYIHGYNKDTIKKIREVYLPKRLDQLKGKEINKTIEKQIEELIEYDKLLDSINNVKINLDDGVLLNYKKLEKLLGKM